MVERDPTVLSSALGRLPNRFNRFDYSSPREEDLDPNFLYLDGGENPLGPPPEYDGKLAEINEKRRKAGGSYGRDITPAIEVLEGKWGELGYVGFSLEGSAGIQHDILTRFLRGRRFNVIGLGPHFPIPVNFIDEQRLRDAPLGWDREVNYKPYTLILQSTFNQTIRAFIADYQNDMRKNVLVLANIPDSPKGDIPDPNLVEELLDFIVGKKWFGLLDEALGEHLPKEYSAIPLLKDRDGIFVVRSLSKGPAIPGEGVGYVVASKNTGEEYKKIETPRAIRRVGALTINSLMSMELDEYYENTRQVVSRVKSIFVNALKERGLTVLPTSMLTTIFTVDGMVENYAEKLREQGILVTSLEDFYVTHDRLISTRYVRASLPMKVVDGELVLIADEAEINGIADMFVAAKSAA